MHTQPLGILGRADLHDRVDMLPQASDLDVDLIAFCGDLHNGSDKAKAKLAAKALASLGPPVLIIPGNTDHKDGVPDLWRKMGLKMIHGQSWRLRDTGFMGLGGMVVRDSKRLEVKKPTQVLSRGG